MANRAGGTGFFRGYTISLDPHRLWVPLAYFGDGLCIWLAFGAGYWLRSLRPHELLPWDVYAGLGLLTVLSYWGVQAGLGGYGESKRLSRFEEWASLLLGLGVTFGLVLAGAFFVRSVSLSRLVVGYAGLLALLGLTVMRAVLRLGMGWLYTHGQGRRRVIWVGSSLLLPEVLERLERCPALGFEIKAWAVAGDPLATVRAVGTESFQEALQKLERLDPTHLVAYVQAHPEIQEVWFGQPELANAPLLLALQALSVQVRLVPDILGFLTVNLRLHSLDGIPLLTLRQPPLRYAHNRFLKRAVDILGASLGLVLLSPLFLVIALLVACSSPGPILYWQERVSLDGRRFWIAKFRTMRVDAEAPGQPGWTRPGDPRRTKIGAFLRRTNLDELPQLWNVLKGEMSLVGPRPERPYFVEQFSQEIPKYPDRHLVKSGLTGWAQIHGLRGDTSIARRTQYDLYYVQNWSLWLDLRILAITLWQGIRGRLNGY